MAALSAGTRAPHFELPAVDGSKFSLQDALSQGPVLAVFFKVSCPVCQYAFPYFERIHRTYGGGKLRVVGLSQNEKKDTSEFIRRYGITFPVLLDNTKTFPVSNAYGLTNVPTAFWIAEDGEIEVASVGWVKQEFEEIARKAAAATGNAPKPLFQAAEQIADFRAG
ncbi:MAG TPA: TlpA disulfide reductase family protein [Terriglobales bacterium]|nr:TlpA disulfide reductase family protein [Terriglobales bacterium]